mgnify:CR=1 FL=1|jgi:uncharacterized coiled-coil protein SlyX
MDNLKNDIDARMIEVEERLQQVEEAVATTSDLLEELVRHIIEIREVLSDPVRDPSLFSSFF